LCYERAVNRPTRIPEYLAASDDFVPRHLGPSADEQAAMLAELGFVSLDALTDATVPEGIRLRRTLALGERLPLGEHEMVEELKNLAADNHCGTCSRTPAGTRRTRRTRRRSRRGASRRW
jgi:glycine cleavage system pyridoxal-binding protein P